MAVSFVSRKCSSCGGKLEYIKDKKMWHCLYCGGESERQEQYDGMFTIKNVVRQVIQDLSYRKIDIASKNLVECEKIDSKYIGTIIAKMSYQMIAAITPGAITPIEAKSLISHLKRSYEQLCEFGNVPNEDEELLYEFFEMDDNFATLILVYDAVGASERRDYLFGILDASKVYSIETNRSLIGFVLKYQKYDIIDKILNNISNLDIKYTLLELLNKHNDSTEKIDRVQRLMSNIAFDYDFKSHFDQYLSNNTDSAVTKGAIAKLAYEKDIKMNLDIVLSKVVEHLDDDNTMKLLKALMSRRIADEEVAKIIEFAYGTKTTDKTLNILSILKETNQFVVLGSKHLVALSSRPDLDSLDKLKVIEKTFEFNLDQKSKEAIVTHYLLYDQSEPRDRLITIMKLFELNGGVSPSTVENYVLNQVTDGELKPSFVECVMATFGSKGYLTKLLSIYLNSKKDNMEIRHKIIESLAKHGLKADSNSFTEYICNSTDEIGAKIKLVKMLTKYGSDFKREAMCVYLESISSEQFSSELFSLIYKPAVNLSSKALVNYVVHFKEREVIKLENIKTLAVQTTMIGSGTAEVKHLGNIVCANIAQAYLLTTDDKYEIAGAIVRHLLDLKIKLNADITVNGKSNEKFKKYVTANKGILSPLTLALCEENKVFSLLF
jgi:hypothetical protein